MSNAEARPGHLAGPARLRLVDASLAFVRHGESTWVAESRFQGVQDPPLSALGQAQARRVAARLADPAAPPALPLPPGPPTGIWHSPLRRAASTAAAIVGAQQTAVPLVGLDALREIGQGAWEGLTLAEVMVRFPRELAAWRMAPATNHAPEGESLQQVAARARLALTALMEALGGPATDGDPDAPHDPLADTPVIGYGPAHAPARTPPWAIVVAHDGVLRLLLMSLLDLPIERYWSFPFALCAVTVLEIRGGSARMRAHNLAGHLDVAVTTPMQ
jgi:probable phosphoglycerate mutase